MGFYNNIIKTYGYETLNILRRYSITIKKLAHMKNRKIFLIRCRSENVLPKFTKLKVSGDGNQSNTIKINKLQQKYQKNLLNIHITETFQKIQHITYFINQLTFHIKNSIPPNLYQNYFYYENIKYERIFNYIKKNNIKKINNLINQTYKKNFNSPTDNNNIINQTNITPPQTFQTLLNLGPKFNLPFQQKYQINNIIAKVESGIEHLTSSIKNNIRTKICNVLTNFKNKIPKPNLYYNRLIKQSKIFIKENPNIIITNADKSNKTVIMFKNHYTEKMMDLLNDKTTYVILKNNPTTTIQGKLNKIIDNLLKNDHINKNLALQLKSYNGIPPKIYGLPKIHKINTPLRPIVSNIDSPTYNLSKFLANILKNITTKNNHYIKDSFEFKKFIDNISVPTNHKLVSFDVISLFTNIPTDLAIKCIQDRWIEISEYTTIPLELFLDAIKICLNSTYFTFDTIFYKQIFGIAMGSPISSVITEIVMEHIQENALKNLDYKPTFYKRYVDDCLLLIPENKINYTLNIFNNLHHRIQFTKESEYNNTINFLDFTLINDQNKIITKWYRKNIKTDTYLNFNSFHPFQHKQSVIRSICDRAIIFSNPKFRKENITLIKEILNKNNYPLNLITNQLKQTTHKLYNQNKNLHTKQNNNKPIYISTPYISNISEKINYILKPHNIILAHKPTNTIKQLFHSKLKDKTPIEKQTNCVYEIPCLHCKKSYYGQTKRYLNTRLYEHKRSTTLLSDNSTGLSKHTNTTGHKFDFKNAKVLNIEKNKIARTFLEMTHIFKNKDNVNNYKDIENLSNIYHNLLIDS